MAPLALIVLGLLAAPAVVQGQLTIIDRVDSEASWMAPDSTWGATTALVVTKPDVAETTTLSTSLLGDLRRMGVRRISAGPADRVDLGLFAACYVDEFKPRNSQHTQWAMVVRISFTLTDATVLLTVTQGFMGDSVYTTETYVETCADIISPVLIDKFGLGR